MQWVGRAAKLHRTACATKGVAKSSHLGFQNVMDTYSTSTQEKKLKSWAILASPLSGRVSITRVGVCRCVVVACARACSGVCRYIWWIYFPVPNCKAYYGIPASKVNPEGIHKGLSHAPEFRSLRSCMGQNVLKKGWLKAPNVESKM